MRADAGFDDVPVLRMLEARLAQYAVVARTTRSLKQTLKGLSYEPMNPRWEIAEFEHHPQDSGASGVRIGDLDGDLFDHSGLPFLRGGHIQGGTIMGSSPDRSSAR
jgi:hypothetical protein